MYEGYDAERIGLQPDWLIKFIEMHKKNHPDAKFKIGDRVNHENCKLSNVEVLAVNVQDDVTVEYAISGHFWLVYEEELECHTPE